MKRILLFSLFLLISKFVFSQTPQGISYQAVAFDSSGSPIVNGNIGIKTTILDNSISGTIVYSEIFTKTTNAQGLFNLNIGEGTPDIGIFSAINWGVNSKFLKVEIDPTGGTSYTIIGTSQLMSVPYALYAEKVNTSSGGSLNDELSKSKYTNFAFSNGSTVYAFNQLTGTWVGQSGSSGTITASNGNFAFSNGSTVYAFSKRLGMWVGQSGSSGSIIASNGSFAFSNGSTVYAFHKEIGVWVGQSGSSGTIIASNGNFAFSNGSTVYAFNQLTGTWVGQSGSSGTIIGSNGNFVFSNGSTVYAFDKEGSIWVGQSGSSGTIVLSESN